jgi:hypothetical protein
MEVWNKERDVGAYFIDGLAPTMASTGAWIWNSRIPNNGGTLGTAEEKKHSKEDPHHRRGIDQTGVSGRSQRTVQDQYAGQGYDTGTGIVFGLWARQLTRTYISLPCRHRYIQRPLPLPSAVKRRTSRTIRTTTRAPISRNLGLQALRDNCHVCILNKCKRAITKKTQIPKPTERCGRISRAEYTATSPFQAKLLETETR